MLRSNNSRFRESLAIPLALQRTCRFPKGRFKQMFAFKYIREPEDDTDRKRTNVCLFEVGFPIDEHNVRTLELSSVFSYLLIL